MKTDLDKIKEKYGGEFMHFCRHNFPNLDEQHVLFSVISSLFHPNKNLLDDIQKHHCVDSFKNYVIKNSGLAVANESDAAAPAADPFELMRKAGYTLYKCETYDDVLRFKKFWNNEIRENLCTFRDLHRTDEFDVFFAVKDGAEPFVFAENGKVLQEGSIDGVARSDFKNPLRQDEYGTSVISLQFSKGSTQTISIKNRYNHVVENPDCTFSSDLENIQAGLTKAFAQKYGFNFVATSQGFEIPGYVLADDGKFYKFNHEMDNTYFCPDNIVISRGKVKQFDKSRYELLENFLIDKVNKTFVDLSRCEDSFCDAFKAYQKMDIKKIENGREFEVRLANGKTAKFTVDKNNQITSYENDSLTEVGDHFLRATLSLERLSLPNLTKAGDYFLFSNRFLSEIDLPKLEKAGRSFMYSNEGLTKFDAPSLVEVGAYFLDSNEKLSEINVPRLENVSIEFLRDNKALVELDAPNLRDAMEYFLAANECLRRLNAPKLTHFGYASLSCNQSLTSLNLPSLQEVDDCVLTRNNSITEFVAPQVTKLGADFLNRNTCLASFEAPNLQEIGNESLIHNQALTEFNAPNLTKLGICFLQDNNALKTFRAPKLSYLPKYFLSKNQTLTEFFAPNVTKIGFSVLENHPQRQKFVQMVEAQAGKGKN